MAETTIEWTRGPNGEKGFSFNPWVGCTKVGPGCDHCYAEGWSKRSGQVQWGAGAMRRRTSEANWRKPLAWNAEAERLGVRYRVFCASLGDVADNEVPMEWRRDLFEQIRITPYLDWLLVTKRIGNFMRLAEQVIQHIESMPDWSEDGPQHPFEALRNWLADWIVLGKPPANVWLGITVVNQVEADRDIPKLLQLKAAVRFLSMEPLLGPVDLTDICPNRGQMSEDHFSAIFDPDDDTEEDGTPFSYIDWVIVGGESGPGARPMHPQWARDIRDQCEAAGVPMMLKQWGEWKPISQMDESEHGGLYKSCVIAKPHENQINLDDIYGRRCTVPSTVLHADGSTHDITEPMAFMQGTEAMLVFRVGKKAAGRLLDGREHNGFPEVPHA